MLWFFTTLMAVSCLAAAALSAEPYNRESNGEKPEDFEKNIKPLVVGIGSAKSVSLYKGLPHQYFEKELLEQELKTQKSVMLHKFPFYDKAITPKEEDVKKLAALCGDRKTFGRYRAPKSCGGYHPDWCVEWKDGEDVYQVLICFGCHEARVYGPKNDVYSDLDDAALKKLVEVLTAYRKNRPERAKLK